MMKRRICLTRARRSSASMGSAGFQAWGSPTVNAAAGTRGTPVIEVSQPHWVPRSWQSKRGTTSLKREREKVKKNQNRSNREGRDRRESQVFALLAAAAIDLFSSIMKAPDVKWP